METVQLPATPAKMMPHSPSHDEHLRRRSSDFPSPEKSLSLSKSEEHDMLRISSSHDNHRHHPRDPFSSSAPHMSYGAPPQADFSHLPEGAMPDRQWDHDFTPHPAAHRSYDGEGGPEAGAGAGYENGSGSQGGVDWAAIRYRWDSWKNSSFTKQLVIACLAEAMGNFLYTFPSGMAIASNILSEGTEGGVLTIGFAYAIGVWFTIVCAAPISGGSFHSSLTLVCTLLGMLSWRRLPFVLASQILGAFFALVLVCWCYWDMIEPARGALRAAGNEDAIFQVGGLGATVTTWRPEGRHIIGYLIINELSADFLTAIVICASFDSSNPFASPTMAGPIVVLVWGWALGTIVGNPARDIGGRLACWAIFGSRTKCFPHAMDAHGALTPTLAIALGLAFYFLFIADSGRPPASSILAQVDEALSLQAARASKKQAILLAERGRKQEEARLRARVRTEGVEFDEVVVNRGAMGAGPGAYADGNANGHGQRMGEEVGYAFSPEARRYF